MQSVNGTILYCVALPLPRLLSLTHALLLPRPTSPSLSLSPWWNRENILVCYYLFIQIVAAVSVAVAGFVFVAVSHLTPKNTHSHNPELGHNSTRRVCSLPRTGMISYTGGALSRRKALCSSKYLIPNTLYTQNETKPKLKPKQGYESCSRMHISYAR